MLDLTNDVTLMKHYALSTQGIKMLERSLTSRTARAKALAIERKIDRHLRKLVAIERRTQDANLRGACGKLIDHYRFDRNWRAYIGVDVC